MDSYLELAKSSARQSLPDVAYSALPDAPVQAYVPRRRLLRRIVTWPSRRRVASLPPPVRTAAVKCAPST